MTENDLLDKLNGIADEDIELSERLPKRRPAARWLAATAAALAALGLFFAVKGAFMKHDDKQAVNTAETPTEAPTATVRPTEQSFTPAPTEAVTEAPTQAPEPTPGAPTAEPTEYPTAQPSSERQTRLFRGAVSAACIPEAPHDAASPEYAAYMAALAQNSYGAWRGLDGFFGRTAKEFLLSGGEERNAVFSPLNVYMELAMLAEASSGGTRAQILGLLGEESVDGLRERVNALWLSNYHDSSGAVSLPAASAWLNEGFNGSLNGEKVYLLSKYHHASIFRGNVSDPAYNGLYRDWLNEQTRDMLAESVRDMELDPSAPMNIAATLYFKLDWEKWFEIDENTFETFHAPSGDERLEFMHGEAESYYSGTDFSMTFKRLKGGARVWFVLPRTYSSLDEVVEKGEALGVILSGDEGLLDYDISVGLNMPKFDVSSGYMLDEGLKRLGVTDCFDAENADFSELTDAKVNVSGLRHCVRVKVNERGVEAAAVTTGTYGIGEHGQHVDFTLDRPFMFVVTGFDGTPLFVGCVYHPGK